MSKNARCTWTGRGGRKLERLPPLGKINEKAQHIITRHPLRLDGKRWKKT
jgi:hypothetical protein